MELNVIHNGGNQQQQNMNNNVFRSNIINNNGDEIFVTEEEVSPNNITVYQQGQEHNISKEEYENKLKKFKIFSKKAKFPDLVSTLCTNTAKMSQYINGLLGKIFVDYHGSKIEVILNNNNTASAVCRIYFMPNNRIPVGDTEFKALVPINQINSNMTIDDKILLLNRAANYYSSRKHYELSKAAKILLRNIVPSERVGDGSKILIKWNSITSEGVINSAYNERGIGVEVVIDLIKFIENFYGTRGTDGSKWAYQYIIGLPIKSFATPMDGIIAKQWQLIIMRANIKDVEKIASEYGYVYDSNSMGIITTSLNPE